MSRLSNKITLVTGAGSGFGAAIARTYAREGAKVILADLNLEAAARSPQSWVTTPTPWLVMCPAPTRCRA